MVTTTYSVATVFIELSTMAKELVRLQQRDQNGGEGSPTTGSPNAQSTS